MTAGGWNAVAASEHLAPSYHWFSISQTSDKTGPLAGGPYDIPRRV